MIVIGNEVLSGRTKDKNIGWVAEKLNSIGINLIEARIIRDNQDVIISTIQELSKKVDYIFTSGGIGPTHDDITTVAIAKAFRIQVKKNKEALRRLEEHYKGTGIELNSARLKMADIPLGAKLIDNPVSAAPGFNVKNVYVMAGVPKIMQAMLDGVIKTIKNGSKTISISIGCNIGEGKIANSLEKINNKYDDLSIGSYPYFKPDGFGTSIVIRSEMQEIVDNASRDIIDAIKKNGGIGEIIN